MFQSSPNLRVLTFDGATLWTTASAQASSKIISIVLIEIPPVQREPNATSIKKKAAFSDAARSTGS
jgi:hypothetical protein